VSGDARRHAAFERRRQQVLGQSPSRLPRWLSPSSAASSRLDCWPRTRVRDASPRGSVLSARCLPDARTRRALAARCRGCRMLLARPTLPAGVRPKSFCATATLYSSERAWIHEKRGPPGGALFQQLGVFFTFRGPQNKCPRFTSKDRTHSAALTTLRLIKPCPPSFGDLRNGHGYVFIARSPRDP
jgi:hypothetical protein